MSVGVEREIFFGCMVSSPNVIQICAKQPGVELDRGF